MKLEEKAIEPGAKTRAKASWLLLGRPRIFHLTPAEWRELLARIKDLESRVAKLEKR